MDKTDKDLVELKNKLIKRRKELLKRISEAHKTEKDVVEAESDDYDKASNAENREMIFAMSSREREELMAIDRSLKRINADKYGICEECGEKIPKKRLQILPFAKHCTECQAVLEAEKLHHSSRVGGYGEEEE